MLRTVYIDGLKSLCELKLDLNPGLNVLVGPNGSGKSNILSAFELISHLNQLDVLNIVESKRLKNACKLFDVHRKSKKIKIKLEGTANSKVGTFSNLQYEYECELQCESLEENCITFFNQFFLLRYEKNGKAMKLFEMSHGNEIENFCRVTDDFANSLEFETPEGVSKEDFANRILGSYFSSKRSTLRRRSLIHEISLCFQPLEAIVKEIESMNPYNFNPDKVRENIESKFHPTIARDGSKLSSVLLEIWENRDSIKTVPVNGFNSNMNYGDIHDHIVSFLNNVSTEISDLKVEFNEKTNKIESEVVFGCSERGKKTISLDLMSDGTLKWLSLVTAILTGRNMFVLEYPENFLNSSMQGQFIDLIRNSTEFHDNLAVFSTHSQTILDGLRPEEIIITYYRNGYTHISRIENVNLLKEILDESGDGLGWHMVTGSLDPDIYGRILPLEKH